MGTLNDEKKLKFDEKNNKNYTKNYTNYKKRKKLETNNVVTFQTIHYEQSA